MIAASLLPEFDQETASTRKLLALIPEDKTGWRPHEKSWTLGELGLHLANLLSWTNPTLEETELDLEPPGGPAWTPPTFVSDAENLTVFDRNAAEARAAIEATSDADMMVPWTLKKAGEDMFSLPRVACIRAFVMNHMIHHRGQLTVYLRQCDVALPSVYGPTADEDM